MKNDLKLIKFMFSAAIISTTLFVIFYIWGLFNYADFYELLNKTLPYCFAAILSVIGFGFALAKYNIDALENASPKTKLAAKKASKTSEIKKKADQSRRLIIKTYDRNGGYHTKQINLRGNYGLLKSA